MFELHWNNFAFLRADDRAIAAVMRLSPPLREVRIMPSDIRCRDGRPVLCVDVEPLEETPESLRADIESIDVAAFDAFLRENPTSTWDGDEGRPELEWQRSLVRALIWLAREVGGPVGYWYHEGNNGLNADIFLGLGPFPAMWANYEEAQGNVWDEAKPRSAYTAALWHIGARVTNLDESRTLRLPASWTRTSIKDLSIGSGGFLVDSTVLGSNVVEQARRRHNVRAVTEKMNRLFNAAPPDDDARNQSLTQKVAGWFKRQYRRDDRVG
jgi:hypothetical protein